MVIYGRTPHYTVNQCTYFSLIIIFFTLRCKVKSLNHFWNMAFIHQNPMETQNMFHFMSLAGADLQNALAPALVVPLAYGNKKL